MDGMPEFSHENWAEYEENVRKTITEKLQMDQRKIEVECAHDHQIIYHSSVNLLYCNYSPTSSCLFHTMYIDSL